MIKLRVFGRCRIYHDPVSPVLKSNAAIGWDALYRDIDLVIERRLKGDELARRMKGWWTQEPEPVIEVINRFGQLTVGEGGELMVELKDRAAADNLATALEREFGESILLKP